MSSSSSSSEASGCPTTKELRKWLDSEQELEPEVVAHVQKCQRCSQTLAALSDDDSLQLFAQGTRVNSTVAYCDEPEFTRLRSRLSELPLNQSLAGEEPNGSKSHPPTTLPGELQPTDADADTDTDIDTETLAALSIGELQRRLPADRFVVDRLLATGGSGAVYLAYDQRLQREVAVKVLARHSQRDRQRFLREARILADLENPNIVRVFDFGTLVADNDSLTTDASSNGQLYLIMEYVPGGTAGELRAGQPVWSASQGQDKPRADTGQMTYQRLARLMASAADGLAAAHAQSLVHRDVKPSNLLLVADWSALKVADFGLARPTDKDSTQVTRTGDLLGTPDFMSPEQVTSDCAITAASDIYSLGATLYQLITGLAPYQGGPAAVLRQIVDSSPVSPRLLVPTIPIDLEIICLHAMQLEPTTRYASMQQMAADLRSFANGEAILARPVSTSTKAMRFLRRNRSFSAALLACIALVCLLTVGSITAAIIFRQQNRNLIAANASEQAAKRSAEEALKSSITAADQLLLAVTTETEFLPRAPGSQEVTRKLLQRARDYFRSFLDANAGNAALTYQLARAHAGLGQVAMRVGDTETLERETEAAIALIDLIPEREIDPIERATLKTDTLVVLANHYTESGEAKRALPLLQEVTQLCRELLDARADTAAPSELRSSYATALFGLANARTWVGKRDDAMPLVKESREIFRRLHNELPDNPTYLRSAAACDMTLGTIALDLNQAAVGQEHFQSALELLNRVSEDDAISLRIRELKIKALTNLALAARRMGNNLEAKENYELAISETRRLIELEPGVNSHQWNLVVAAMNSGGPEMELGNLEPLVERWQATLPVLEKLIGRDPGNQRYQQVKAMLQSNIAIILRDMGKLDEAIAPLKAATETLRQQAEKLDYAAESYLPVALNHYELAATFIQLKRWPEALQALDASDAIVKQILDKDPVFTPARGHMLDSLDARLEVLHKQPGSDLALRRELARKSLDLARELASSQADVAEYRVEVPRALNDLARTQLDSAEFDAASETAREAHNLLDAILADQAKAAQQSSTEPTRPVTLADAPPEWRSCKKRASLIEARALRGNQALPLEPKIQAAVDALLDQARQLGASDEEIKAVLE